MCDHPYDIARQCQVRSRVESQNQHATEHVRDTVFTCTACFFLGVMARLARFFTGAISAPCGLPYMYVSGLGDVEEICTQDIVAQVAWTLDGAVSLITWCMFKYV
jgi:hypothetical protein